jgi:hypothetical protein
LGIRRIGVPLRGRDLSQAATIFLPYLKKEFKKQMTIASADQVSNRLSSRWEKRPPGSSQNGY